MAAMKKEEIQELITRLLAEIEEEDIGISLFSTFYQNQAELDFFGVVDRDRVVKTLKKLSDDSKRHKTVLEDVIHVLEKKLHEK